MLNDMGVFDGMNESIRKTGREWSEWARKNARDLGERSMRHLERQDLLTERKRHIYRVGEFVVHKMLELDKKSIRADAAELSDLLDSIRSVDDRLGELDEADTSHADPNHDETDPNG